MFKTEFLSSEGGFTDTCFVYKDNGDSSPPLNTVVLTSNLVNYVVVIDLLQAGEDTTLLHHRPIWLNKWAVLFRSSERSGTAPRLLAQTTSGRDAGDRAHLADRALCTGLLPGAVEAITDRACPPLAGGG